MQRCESVNKREEERKRGKKLRKEKMNKCKEREET